MARYDEHTSLDVLSRAECLGLLNDRYLGRIAFRHRDQTLVLPVNYALDGDDVVCRTAADSQLAVAVPGQTVAFEVDEADAVYRTGWSVLVRGEGHRVDDPAERARLEQLPLRSWDERARDVWLRIVPHSVTGRRVAHRGAG